MWSIICLIALHLSWPVLGAARPRPIGTLYDADSKDYQPSTTKTCLSLEHYAGGTITATLTSGTPQSATFELLKDDKVIATQTQSLAIFDDQGQRANLKICVGPQQRSFTLAASYSI